MRVAEAHTLQQLEKVVLRREEISDKAMMKTLNSGLCEPMHFGSLRDLNEKKALVTGQHLP